MSLRCIKKSFHLKDCREKAIIEIQQDLGFLAAEIKSKILNLRSQLGRVDAKIRRTESGQATEELCKSPWTYWEHLQFLFPIIKPGKSTDTEQLDKAELSSTLKFLLPLEKKRRQGT